MAFRQTKTDASRPSQEWHIWIERHRAELLAIGLPEEVHLDAARWSDSWRTATCTGTSRAASSSADCRRASSRPCIVS